MTYKTGHGVETVSFNKRRKGGGVSILQNASLKIKIVAGFMICILSGVILLPLASLAILGTETATTIVHLIAPKLLYLAAAGVVGLICGVAIIYWLVKRTVLDRIERIMAGVDLVASGNLQTTFFEDSSDELGVLAKNMNRMSAAVSTTIDNILTSASTLMSIVDKLKIRAEQTADGAVEQSKQAAQIAAASEEMSRTINEIATNASSATESSAEAMETAESGKMITDISVKTVNEVNAATAELASMFEKLNSSVAEIGNIISEIKGIADQTNLLALNAAIEAARAGEQGRGFSVVADEVRKLAERTIKAAAEITEKISIVQEESLQTTKSMAGSTSGVTKAAGHIKNLNNVLETIVESVQHVRGQIAQIASAVKQQASAAEDVATNISKTAAIAQEIETVSNETRSRIDGLTGMGDRLRRDVAGFTTRENKVMAAELAKSEHRKFMEVARSALRGAKVTVADLPECLSCPFGEWFKGQEGADQALREPHDRIHDLAKKVVTLCAQGKRSEAEALYREMETLTDEISRQLDEVRKGAGARA
jgi:methyl-accepting chemotaxis protein